VFFNRRNRPKSAAELADDAEIEKLSEEATWGELDNEKRVISRRPRYAGWRHGPVGFFNSPGVKMPDEQAHAEEPAVAARKV